MMMLQVGMGDSGPKAVLPATLTGTKVYPGSATITIGAAGGWTTNGGSGTWLIRGTGADFEIRASGRTGSIPSGTFDSWMSLSASRSWSLAASSGTELTCTFTIEIRRASDGVVVDSCVATLQTFTLA